MSQDQCPRKDFPQFAEQGEHGCFLLQCTGICGDAVAGESALIADADGVGVVVPAMCAHSFQGSSAVDFAVACDVEVVTDVRESPVADVVPAAGFKIQAPPLGGGGAVENNQGDGSHGNYAHAFRPNAPAMAVARVMITFRTSVQVFFFVFESIYVLFLKG